MRTLPFLVATCLWGGACGGGSDARGSGSDGGPGDPRDGGGEVPSGTEAELRDVVINELNWAGSASSATDEWIELYNTRDSLVDLTGWTIEGGGKGSASALEVPVGTVIPAGGYLVLATQQGADKGGERTSLTGVDDVIVVSVGLSNDGEELLLLDPSGDVIDRTPDGAWPAGDSELDLTMERRDDKTGGGYGAGDEAGSWYSWSLLDGTDTTHAETSERGTPAADNSDPSIFDHFTIAIEPTSPRARTDFTMTVTAYRSSDDSQIIESYTGSVTASIATGALSGGFQSQPITGGVAVLTVQTTTAAEGVEISVTDDIYPQIAGSVTVDIAPEGDVASAGAVVISEVNWYGNGVSSSDEWIELRNVSGNALNLSGWTIDAAATSDGAVTIGSGTVLASGAYLVIADQQGPDMAGMRTSVTGVSPVQIQPLSLSNPGEALILRDAIGTAIDATPSGSWPAGDSSALISMERRDDISGGGYGDGSLEASWYSWNSAAGVDTTHSDTADNGTPGAANSDPEAFVPPVSLPYSTGFEASDPAFENLATGGFSNVPPAGTTARIGSGVMTTDSITTSYGAREIQSVDCLTLSNGTDAVVASAFATASSNNGDNVLRARWRILWFDDAACSVGNATSVSDVSTGVVVGQGSYTEVSASVVPPAAATHIKVRFEIHDDNGGNNLGDDWAADDVSVTQ